MGRSREPRRRPAGPPVDTVVGRAEVVADRVGRGRTLLIDGNVHGHVDPGDPAVLALDYQARMTTLVLALLPRPAPDGRRPVVVHLGGGAVAIPRAVAAHRPDVDHVVVERSAAVIALAARELGLRRDAAARLGITVRKADGRAAVQRLPPGSADVVVGDAFVGDRTPAHMATVEFAEEVRRVLTAGGAYVVNIIDEQPWTRLGAQAAAADRVFDDIAAAGSRGVARLRDPGNVFLMAGSRLDRQALTAAGAVARHPVALVGGGPLRTLVQTVRARRDADG